MNLFETRELELRTRHAFIIARGGSSIWRNVVVHLGQDELEGWGEGAPRGYYAESVDQSLEALTAWGDGPGRDLELGSADPSRVLEAFRGPAAARCALDMALHDAAARRQGVTVTEWLRQRHDLRPGPPPRTSFTLGLDTREALLEKAHEAADYPIIKLKLGTDWDLESVEAVRSVTAAELRVDANCAWTVEETLERAPRLQELGVTLMEQPLAGDDLDGYRELRGRLSLPVIADESCRGPQDLDRLAQCVDGVNIKLSKVGGLAVAAGMLHEARERGLTVMLGCFIESSLAITAAAHLAPFADYLDLDGAALLAEDPFTGVDIGGGILRMPAGPGLGVVPR